MCQAVFSRLANLSLAGAARHVVAAAVLLDGHATAGAVSQQGLVVVRQAVGLYGPLSHLENLDQTIGSI